VYVAVGAVYRYFPGYGEAAIKGRRKNAVATKREGVARESMANYIRDDVRGGWMEKGEKARDVWSGKERSGTAHLSALNRK
jgi:hypothetical protein